jgi:two-component system chemotaxis response regulator CheY
VVEDDDELRGELAAILSEMGVEVLEARDGVEGLERLERGPLPSAILLDMWMPRLDGVGFLAAMRKEPALAGIPVVTMTGGPDPIPDGGVTSRLHKPFDLDELARILISL